MLKSLALIEQLISMEEFRDKEWKALMISVGKGKQAVGDSAMFTHLKSLRELIKLEAGITDPVLSLEPCCGGECGCQHKA